MTTHRRPKTVQRMKRLGRRIREKRLEMCMDQAEMAALLTDEHGCPTSQTTISRYESGEIEITLEKVRKIEKILNVLPGTLLLQSGYIDPVATQRSIEWSIQSDPDLNPEYKDLLIGIYHNFLDSARLVQEANSLKRSDAARK